MKHLLFGIFLLCSLSAFSQGKDRFRKGDTPTNTAREEKEAEADQQKKTMPPSLWDRVVFGGNASAQFGTSTFILVAPKVGYRVTERYTAGLGFLYQYASLATINRQTGVVTRGAFKSSTYGPLVFNFYNVTDFAYVGAQAEYLNHDILYYNPNTGDYFTERAWTPVLFLEVGYRQALGSKGAVQLGLKYNVLHENGRSPYGSAWFPVIGFFF
jgi:hypothetical protein